MNPWKFSFFSIFRSAQSSHNSRFKTGTVLLGWGGWIGLLKCCAIFFSVAFVLRASVVEAFKIPSSSMQPTLEVGDRILVNKLSYGLRIPFASDSLVEFRTPQRGDVVVFTLPDDPRSSDIDESDTNIVKRVVGLPGDTVVVRGKKLYINDQVYNQDEDYAVWVAGGLKNFGPVTVPKDAVLLLGDNRDQSKDSRYWRRPFLDTSRIKGRAFLIFWNWPEPLKRMFHIIK